MLHQPCRFTDIAGRPRFTDVPGPSAAGAKLDGQSAGVAPCPWWWWRRGLEQGAGAGAGREVGVLAGALGASRDGVGRRPLGRGRHGEQEVTLRRTAEPCFSWRRQHNCRVGERKRKEAWLCDPNHQGKFLLFLARQQHVQGHESEQHPRDAVRTERAGFLKPLLLGLQLIPRNPHQALENTGLRSEVPPTPCHLLKVSVCVGGHACVLGGQSAVGKAQCLGQGGADLELAAPWPWLGPHPAASPTLWALGHMTLLPPCGHCGTQLLRWGQSLCC